MPRTTVAVLGTGTMGEPIARNLVRTGFVVRVWNRTREKAEPLASMGATVTDTPAEAADGAHFVLTMLTDLDAVLEVMEEANGAFGPMAPDAIWLQMSTVGVDGAAWLVHKPGLNLRPSCPEIVCLVVREQRCRRIFPCCSIASLGLLQVFR